LVLWQLEVIGSTREAAFEMEIHDVEVSSNCRSVIELQRHLSLLQSVLPKLTASYTMTSKV